MTDRQLLDGLGGRTLVQFCVGAGVRLDLDGSPHYEITIECPLSIDNVGIKDAEPTSLPVLTVLRDLLMTAIASVSEHAGRLSIVFDELTITVPPDDRYEAWQVRADNGLQMVCVPGGDLAIWQPE